jgi:hypothetical protein
MLPPINVPLGPGGSPARIEEVAVFKAQVVVAPTLAALLVNLDQGDRLVLQAPEVPSPPSRRARLGRL